MIEHLLAESPVLALPSVWHLDSLQSLCLLIYVRNCPDNLSEYMRILGQGSSTWKSNAH